MTGWVYEPKYWGIYLAEIPPIEESPHIVRARWRAKQWMRDQKEKRPRDNVREIKR